MYRNGLSSQRSNHQREYLFNLETRDAVILLLSSIDWVPLISVVKMHAARLLKTEWASKRELRASFSARSRDATGFVLQNAGSKRCKEEGFWHIYMSDGGASSPPALSPGLDRRVIRGRNICHSARMVCCPISGLGALIWRQAQEVAKNTRRHTFVVNCLTLRTCESEPQHF